MALQRSKTELEIGKVIQPIMPLLGPPPKSQLMRRYARYGYHLSAGASFLFKPETPKAYVLYHTNIRDPLIAL